MIIPTHKITDHAESGISIRRLTPDIVMPADRPLHRDDYFAFCLLLTLLPLWHVAKRWKALVNM